MNEQYEREREKDEIENVKMNLKVGPPIKDESTHACVQCLLGWLVLLVQAPMAHPGMQGYVGMQVLYQ